MAQAECDKQRIHEQRMKELDIITNSSLRDQYAEQLLSDKILAPLENAQHKIQNTAKHAQYLAEVLGYHHSDHGLSLEEAQAISHELRILANILTGAESLYDLKLVYVAATLFNDQVASFRHTDRKYSLSRELRKNILDPLNTCIADHQNFQRRRDFYPTENKVVAE
jgi:hypothetical protein